MNDVHIFLTQYKGVVSKHCAAVNTCTVSHCLHLKLQSLPNLLGLRSRQNMTRVNRAISLKLNFQVELLPFLIEYSEMNYVYLPMVNKVLMKCTTYFLPERRDFLTIWFPTILSSVTKDRWGASLRLQYPWQPLWLLLLAMSSRRQRSTLWDADRNRNLVLEAIQQISGIA